MIHELLLASKSFCKTIQILFERKPKKKVLKKAAEELSELTTKILQALNSKTKVADISLLEEIVDVQMHVLLLEKYFDADLVKEVVEAKIKKMEQSKDVLKYAAAA